MDKFVLSSDHLKIHYTQAGSGSTALLFVHGWLGNMQWWSSQLAHFADKYKVVAMDLPGHGKSEKSRTVWSGQQYADDIKTVASQIDCESLILVGHSMSGSYVLEASLLIPNTKAIILVDTIKNLDQLMTIQQADELVHKYYREDFNSAVKNLLPKFLFTDSTPLSVRERLQNEFLNNDSDHAIKVVEPLYKMDLREIASKINVPVRAINSEIPPTSKENNRKYLRDFDYSPISGTGHYPMLELPEEFNRIFADVLKNLSL